MFNAMNNGYSLADIAAATGNGANGDFFGGNNGWWIILLFLIWGNNGWGYGTNPYCNQTQSGITDGYILTSDFANIERKIDSVNAGLCDSFYAMNTGMLNGFAGVNNNITQQTIAEMQNANALTAQINGVANQMQHCCCDGEKLIESKFADLNYNLATLACQTRQAVADAARDLQDNNNAGVREILKYLTEDKIATLQSENQALKYAASQSGQCVYILRAWNPTPIPSYTVPEPYAPYANVGRYGCGCATI